MLTIKIIAKESLTSNLRNQTNIINTINLNLFALREQWLENSSTKYYDSIKCDNVQYLITGFDDVMGYGDNIGIRDGNMTSRYDVITCIIYNSKMENESKQKESERGEGARQIFLSLIAEKGLLCMCCAVSQTQTREYIVRRWPTTLEIIGSALGFLHNVLPRMNGLFWVLLHCNAFVAALLWRCSSYK